MKKRLSAGVDIGGTKIAVALETEDGQRVAARRFPTAVELGPDRIVRNIFTAVSELTAGVNGELGAIGIGCPGPIDIDQGLVMSPTNLPDWVEFPLVRLARQQFRVPVALDNDANAAALGEFHFGAAQGFKDLFYVTVSTGIGGAIICDGEIHHGVKAGAGEIGHTIVAPDGERCRCGARGCLETIASGTAIAHRMREALAAQNGGDISKFSEVTTACVVEKAQAGDPTALAVWDEAIRFLAIGIGNAITLTAPQVVVVGGGVASAGEFLLEPLRRAIRKNVTMLPVEEVEIRSAVLGAESGVRGALVLAHDLMERRQHAG
jgi:glucokinase